MLVRPHASKTILGSCQLFPMSWSRPVGDCRCGGLRIREARPFRGVFDLMILGFAANPWWMDAVFRGECPRSFRPVSSEQNN